MAAFPNPWRYNAILLEVHDGDTLITKIDWGMRRYDEPIPVRLAGCAARELNEAGGPEARDFVATLVPKGTPLLLETVKPDKYQPRWIAHVTAYPPGKPSVRLTAYLIEQGWAVPWDGRGPQPKPAWPRVPTQIGGNPI
jgi:endonuclease YncB( thermonuclease family)